MPELILLGLLIALFPLALLVLTLIRFRRRWFAPTRRAGRDTDRICRKCGYNLAGLDLPRCPECGALYGFDVSMADLGLAEQELQSLRRNKQAQSSSNDPVDTPSQPRK